VDVRDDSRTILLSRLDGVRQTHRDRWIALCPAHDDRSPSLSLRELDDGRLLIKCFAQCSPAAVVHAIGLELAHLFPPRPTEHYRGRVARSQRPYLTSRELRALLQHYATVVLLAAEDMAAGRVLSSEDLETLRAATVRIRRVLEASHEPG
jgi:hypothetical protein